MSENQDNNKILGAYKQTTALLFVIGVLLGSYTIKGSGWSNSVTGVVALLVVLFAAYQYYKVDSKRGIFLIVIAILWVIAYILVLFKVLPA